MKTTKHKIILLLILTLPILFLTSCYELSDADWELVEIAFESWAEENGLLENDQWQPDAVIVKAVEDKVAEITNEDTAVQLDAVNAVRDMEKATQLADEAMLDLDTAKMSSAVSLRPHDWTLQEKDAAVWLAHGNAAAAQTAFAQSDDLFLESVINNDEDCVWLREQQLTKRRETLFEVARACKKNPNCTDSEYADLWSEYKKTNSLLHEIFVTRKSDFCPDS